MIFNSYEQKLSYYNLVRSEISNVIRNKKKSHLCDKLNEIKDNNKNKIL